MIYMIDDFECRIFTYKWYFIVKCCICECIQTNINILNVDPRNTNIEIITAMLQ